MSSNNPHLRTRPRAPSHIRKHRCQQCGRLFERKDTLTRHLQVHDETRELPAPRQKSCIYCSRAKIKCSRTLPACQSCLRHNRYCEYPPATWKRAMQQHRGSTSSATHGSPDPQILSAANNSIATSDPAGIRDLSSGSEYTTTHNNDFSQPEMVMEHRGGNIEPSNHLFSVGEFEFDSMGFMDLSQYAPSTGMDWIFSNSLPDTLIPPSSFLNPTYFEDDVAAAENSAYQHNQQPNRPLVPPVEHSQMLSQLSIRSSGSTRTEPSPQLSPFSIDLNGSAPTEPSSDIPRNNCEPDDPWPMEWYATSLHNSELPILGNPHDEEIDGSSFFGMIPLTDATIERLKEATRLPSETPMWPELNLDKFPSKQKLDHCIDLYFAHFHRTLPIIHRPTFDATKHPAATTLAIACIGACYTGLEGARNFSNSLSELNRRLLLFMSEQDRRFVRTEFYVGAQLLQGTHGYSSGYKRLFELSDSFRSSLVNNARCMGLFQDRPKTVPINDSLEARWHAWISDERLCRLAWAIYEYDSSVSYLHNTRPFLSVSEINLSMPCPLPLWEAETGHVWLSLHPWTKSLSPNPFFRPMLHSLFKSADKVPAKVADFQHDLIIINTLTRTLWSVKEFEGSAVNDFVRGSSSLTEAKVHVQEVLDRFLFTQPPKSHSKAEMSYFVRKMHTIHMSHLYGAGDLMDWLRPLFRGGPGAETAKSRAKQWGSRDPVRLRRVAFHSAQVLSMARRYLQNESREAFNVFNAGIVLWCIAGLAMQKPLDKRPPGTASPYRLDGPASDGEKISPVHLEWIRNGSTQVVSMHGVPRVFTKAGQTQVLEQTASILETMQVWGIAQNLLQVVSLLIQREDTEKP